MRKGAKDAQIGFRFKAPVDTKLRGAFNEARKELLSVSDKDGDGNSHTPLTGSTKRSAGNRVQRVVYVG